MSKPRKKQGNPDFRHRVTVPAPSSQEMESRLFEYAKRNETKWWQELAEPLPVGVSMGLSGLIP